MNQEHHDEQMQAFRRDFMLEWTPIRTAFKSRGASDRWLALEELRRWRRWLHNKTSEPKDQ